FANRTSRGWGGRGLPDNQEKWIQSKEWKRPITTSVWAGAARLSRRPRARQKEPGRSPGRRPMVRWRSWNRLGFAAVLLSGLVTGCHTPCNTHPNGLLHPCAPIRPVANQPNEAARVVVPNYIIEPPDVLMIDAVRVVPIPPYRIEPLDTLAISVTETLPMQPIAGLYVVEPEGTVNLGFTYGSVQLVDKTLEEAKATIEAQLKTIVRTGYQVTV